MKIAGLCFEAIANHVFPGVSVGVIKNGEASVFSAGNDTYSEDGLPITEQSVFDIASVTKSVALAGSFLMLLEREQIAIEDRVVTFLPEFGTDQSKAEVTIGHLLTYTLDLDVPSMASLKDLSPQELIQRIVGAPLRAPVGTTYLYTNSTALVLGLLFEKIAGETLPEFAGRELYQPLGMSRTTFFPERLGDAHIVPTEIDEWRGGEVRGVVHDESSFVLAKAGVYPGMAGLFSTVPDLLVFLKMILDRGVHAGKRFYGEETIQKMHTNQLEAPLASAYGWEIGSSDVFGSVNRAGVFGKTGFTGCFMAGDMNKGAGLVILSNRTYPKRPATKQANQEFRHRLLEIVFGKS